MIVLKVLLALSVISKGYLHSHIASRNNIDLGAGGGLPYKSLWYFTQPLSESYERLKKVCNYLQTGNIILLILILAISNFL